MFVVLVPGGTAQKIIILMYGAWSQLELERFCFLM